MVIEPSDQNTLTFFTEAAQLFKLQAEEKSIDLQMDVAKSTTNNDEDTDTNAFICDGDVVRVDEHKMRQVVRNLVSNALKFTEYGKTVKIKIRKSTELIPKKVSAEEAIQEESSKKIPILPPTFSIVSVIGNILRSILGYRRVSNSITAEELIPDVENQANISSPKTDDCVGTLIVSVIDGGVGMAPEDSKRLFKEVVQFNPGKLQAGGGSGLGMMITKGIVDLHGGEISAHSDGIGHGSTFTLKLPLYRGEPAAVTIPQPAGKGRRLSYRGSKGSSPGILGVNGAPTVHFLVVDDSRLNRKMLGKVLTSEEFTYEEAEDGIVALEMLNTEVKRRNYDVIMIDFMMPKMDGPTATKEIRALGYDGLIFGVTGNAMKAEMDTFLDSGVDDVFVKPMDVDKLKRLLKDYNLGLPPVKVSNLPVIETLEGVSIRLGQITESITEF